MTISVVLIMLFMNDYIYNTTKIEIVFGLWKKIMYICHK